LLRESSASPRADSEPFPDRYVEYTRLCPVGSSTLTKAWLFAFVGVAWKADAAVVGKLVDVVLPATTTLKAKSAATPTELSRPSPPKYVENKIAEPAAFNLLTNTLAVPAIVPWNAAGGGVVPVCGVSGKSVEVVEPAK
jgi:hypothetical protein